MLLQHAGQGKDVADVVIDDQRLLPGQLLRRFAPLRQELACLPGQALHCLMQEQRSFLEHRFGRADVLEDDDFRQLAQAVVLVPALTVGAVHDDGDLGGVLGLGEVLEEICRAHVAQRPIHDDAVERAALRGLERLLPASHSGDLDAVGAQRLADAFPLRRVAVGDEQRLDLAIDELARPGQGFL